MVLMLKFCKKNFSPLFFSRIKVHLSKGINIDSHNNLSFFIGHYKHVLLIRIIGIDALVWQEKLFFPMFSKAFSSNETNLDSHNNVHFFVIGLYNHIFLFGIHDIDALVWHEVLFFPPLSSKSKFIHQIRQTWIPMVIFIPFMIG